MDTQREKLWQWIKADLLASCDGTLFLQRAGRRMRSGLCKHWPSDAGQRQAILAELEPRMAKLAGRWVLYYLAEDVKDRDAERWPWPAPEGLFDEEVQAAIHKEEGSKPAEAMAGYHTADEEPASDGMEAFRSAGEATASSGAQMLALPSPAQTDNAQHLAQSSPPLVGYSSRAAQLIIRLIEEAGHRLTASQIIDAFISRNWKYSSTTLQHTLPELRRRGLLTNTRDGRGVGFGLPGWPPDDGPQEADEPTEDELD